MIGDKKYLKTCQGGDCKVFGERKLYNTTLTKHQGYNGYWGCLKCDKKHLRQFFFCVSEKDFAEVKKKASK